MITGFNTDIEYNGVIYHVQTEDKGLSTPLILSLVYDRGTILASKRSPYNDLIANGFDEKVLSERLQKQHKLICAAIRAGRLEDLKKLSEKTEKTANVPLPEPDPAALPRQKKPEPQISIPRPNEAELIEFIFDIEESGPIIDAVEILEEIVIPAEAVEIITDELLPSTGKRDELEILLFNDTQFRGGERRTLNIGVTFGVARAPIAGAPVMVKVLGSSFRPLIFHARTDAGGGAVVHLQLPHFKTGRAAVLIRTMHNGEEAELRRVVANG